MSIASFVKEEGVRKVLFMWAFAKRPYITYFKNY